MSETTPFIIEGASSGGVRLRAGERVRITNIEGSQVVDLWTFVQPGVVEYLSAEHTRSCLQKLVPKIGDSLYSNLRRALLTIVEDTSGASHDLLMSACDEHRYQQLGHVGYHRNCAENLLATAAEFGHDLEDIPSPFNIFQRVEIDDEGRLEIVSPLVEAGQFITLEAQVDLLVIMSACPMDIALTNGPDRRSKPVEVQKLS